MLGGVPAAARQQLADARYAAWRRAAAASRRPGRAESGGRCSLSPRPAGGQGHHARDVGGRRRRRRPRVKVRAARPVRRARPLCWRWSESTAWASDAAQRTHEIGVRLALGADPGRVSRAILGKGLAIVLAGLALGLAGAVALGALARQLPLRRRAARRAGAGGSQPDDARRGRRRELSPRQPGRRGRSGDRAPPRIDRAGNRRSGFVNLL